MDFYARFKPQTDAITWNWEIISRRLRRLVLIRRPDIENASSGRKGYAVTTRRDNRVLIAMAPNPIQTIWISAEAKLKFWARLTNTNVAAVVFRQKNQQPSAVDPLKRH